MQIEPEAALTEFGFNQLESLVYCELLRQSPATGYRLSQRIGRAPANIYQALKALLQKGAILEESDAADAASYVPMPPDQLFAGLRSTFLEKAEAAVGVLGNMRHPPAQETLLQLRTASQVVERARAMIAGAYRTVIFDAMPPLYDLFRTDFDAARERGVAVAGIAYREADVGPTMPFKGEPPDAVVQRWPGLGMILVSDASEQLVAQVSVDMAQVMNAVYSDSSFLSCIMHGLLQADIRLVALRSDPDAPVPASPLDAFALRVARPPGLVALLGTGQPFVG